MVTCIEYIYIYGDVATFALQMGGTGDREVSTGNTWDMDSLSNRMNFLGTVIYILLEYIRERFQSLASVELQYPM